MRGRGHEIWRAGRQASKHNFIRGILTKKIKNAGRRMFLRSKNLLFSLRKIESFPNQVSIKITSEKRQNGKFQGGEGGF